MATTDELIKEAQESLEAEDEARLATAIGELVKNEPSRWRLLLALNGIWPEPNPRPSNKDSERLDE